MDLYLDYYFIIISAIATTAAIVFSFATKGIQYHNHATDNELMVSAAAQSHKWRWLSDVHKFGIKTGTKYVSIVLISFFQKIMGDKTSDHTYTTASGFATAFSGILIYLIGMTYWGNIIGFFLALLFLASLWPWQINLFGGHPNISSLFFLFAILFVQQVGSGFFNQFIWLSLAGFMFCLSQFASASAIKYIPLFFAAIFYSANRLVIEQHGLIEFVAMIADKKYFWLNIVILAAVTVFLLVLNLSYKKLVSLIYFQRGPKFLNKVFEGRNDFPLEFYMDIAKKKVRLFNKWFSVALVFCIIILNFAGFPAVFSVLIGFGVCFVLLNLPNIKKSFKYYFDVIDETQIRKKSHFRLYVDYFAKKGIKVSRLTQGGGIGWLPRVFFRFAPFHTLLFFASVVLAFVISGPHISSIIKTCLMVLFSLSPIIWAELSGAPQVARTYSPGFISGFLMFGYFLHLIRPEDISFVTYSMFAFLVIVLAWNSWKFISDVFPARMTVSALVKKIDKLGIEEIYTYETYYNDILINNFFPAINKRVKVNYIKSIGEVSNGWIVVPCTSAKALPFESEPRAIKEGDFRKDPILNKIIDSEEIGKIASYRFQTYGTSPFWRHESEVLSFRDLMLHEVQETDVWRSYAWLIDAKKLAEIKI